MCKTAGGAESSGRALGEPNRGCEFRREFLRDLRWVKILKRWEKSLGNQIVIVSVRVIHLYLGGNGKLHSIHARLGDLKSEGYLYFLFLCLNPKLAEIIFCIAKICNIRYTGI